MLSCAEASSGAGSSAPAPGDLVVGPLLFFEGQTLATANPAGYGQNGSYKVPLALIRQATVTVTIAARARRFVVISNPYGPLTGVAAATYRSCRGGWTVFAQGFSFTDGRIRGCVPLDVQIDNQLPVRHVTISLFAGSCPSSGVG
jgi:hypothetical protein